MIKQVVAAALTIGTLLAGTGAEAGGIPKNFLLTEAEARRPLSPVDADEVWWKISDSLSRPLDLNPCGAKREPGDGRTAMRTITYVDSGPSSSAEQLVVHRSAESARAAFRRLRSDLKRCPGDSSGLRYVAERMFVGNESMLVGGYHSDDRGKLLPGPGQAWFVGRRGSAVFLFTADESSPGLGRRLTRQARTMAAKVCDLRGVCDCET